MSVVFSSRPLDTSKIYVHIICSVKIASDVIVVHCTDIYSMICKYIQVCPTKKTGSKKRKASDHVPVAGQDPSPEDIERAKELQAIPPPKCE